MQTQHDLKNIKGRVTNIDKHVGEKLRHLRLIKGLSQEKLAETVDVSIQQIQKYEKGTNRVSSGKLFLFAQLLKVQVTYFFEELPLEIQELDYSTTSEREACIFFKAFTLIKDAQSKATLLHIIKAMSDNTTEKISSSA